MVEIRNVKDQGDATSSEIRKLVRTMAAAIH